MTAEPSGAHRLHLKGDLDTDEAERLWAEQGPTSSQLRLAAENNLLRRTVALEWAIEAARYEALPTTERAATQPPTLKAAHETVRKRYIDYLAGVVREACRRVIESPETSTPFRALGTGVGEWARMIRAIEGQPTESTNTELEPFEDALRELDVVPADWMLNRVLGELLLVLLDARIEALRATGART